MCNCSNKTIKIVTDNSDQFQKANDADAGYDLISNETCYLMGQTRELVTTDLKVLIPKGYVGIIKSRSGLSVKHGLEVGAGVIDSGYTGQIKVVMHNHSNETYMITPGDKIAQMIVIPIFQGKVELVESLEETDRGEAGFNSTGYRK